jgi:hypothetical protein
MMTLMKKMSVLGLSVAMLSASFLPSQAMPRVVAAAPAAASDVVDVQYWRDGPPPRRYYGRDYNRSGYYGGYRGYREHRPNHRYRDGYWYPLAAFAAGAIIGGAIAQPRPEPRYVPAPRYAPEYRAPAPVRAGLNPRHYEYCAARYRSYDSYSNTFQPYEGPRQQCLSPYY